MPFAVAAYGEALWDLLPEGPVLGGAPTNFAYRLNELGERAAIVTRLGKDEFGERAAQRMRALGMDMRFVQWDGEHPTGTVEIVFDAKRQPDYTIVPNVAYDFMEFDEGLRQLAASASAVCFGTLIQRRERSRRTLEALLDSAAAESLRFLDINLRKLCYSRETVLWSLDRANLLKLNEDEAAALDGMLELGGGGLLETGQRLVERWALRHCIVTLGERGALCFSAGENPLHEPGYAVELADPCGSGDAFSAGFLHGLLAGHDRRECCRLGNALGAIVATQAGATAPISAGDRERFLAATVERRMDERFAALA